MKTRAVSQDLEKNLLSDFRTEDATKQKDAPKKSQFQVSWENNSVV